MKKIVIILCIITVNQTIKAQDFENIIIAGKEDASLYLGNFIEPVFKGLIYNFNSGWYHTGRTHKKWGFDLSINASASIVPNEDKSFRFNNNDYNILSLQNDTTAVVPTVLGQSSNAIFDVNIPIDNVGNIIPQELIDQGVVPASFRVASFETINGIEEDLPIKAIVPTPMVQFTLGLPTKTDIILRYVPNIGSNGVKFKLFGLGFKHNLLQHFKFADKVPILDVSILAAFTTATTLFKPEESVFTGENQETELKLSAFTTQLITTAKFKLIDLYMAVGLSSGKASLKIKGDYDLIYNIQDINGIPNGTTFSETITNPIDINTNIKNSINATFGARLNLFGFKLFTNYTFQEYNTLNLGFAFSFR